MNEENEKKQRKSSLNASVILSFAVAIFAIAALVTVGFNNISFAAPLDPDAGEFTMVISGDKIYSKGHYNNDDDYNVPMYYADTNKTIQVFCIEHSKQVGGGEVYKRQTEITDYGLLYILSNTLASGKTVTPDANPYVETWITQTAIWAYLRQLNEEELNIVKSTTELVAVVNHDEQIEVGSNSVNLYNTYVKDLVASADVKSLAGYVIVKKADNKLYKSEDGKTYRTSEISVTADNPEDLQSYKVSLKGIEGAYVVGEDGKTINEGDVITDINKKLFVIIPADKVKDVKKDLVLNVDATFKFLGGYIYSDDADDQDVVTVEDQEAHILGGTVFEIIGTPDTGMNTAQTIYFIGLVVLLCGVGIIYANAKPVKKQAQQQ